jgi:hypothetical protein
MKTLAYKPVMMATCPFSKRPSEVQALLDALLAPACPPVSWRERTANRSAAASLRGVSIDALWYASLRADLNP